MNTEVIRYVDPFSLRIFPGITGSHFISVPKIQTGIFPSASTSLEYFISPNHGYFPSDFQVEQHLLSAIQKFTTTCKPLQIPATTVLHNSTYASLKSTVCKERIQLCKGCWDIQAAPRGSAIPRAPGFPFQELSLLHTPSAWDSSSMDGFQLLQKTKGRHIWQKSCKMFINHGWSCCCCDVLRGSLWRAAPSCNLINPVLLVPVTSGISVPHKSLLACRGLSPCPFLVLPLPGWTSHKAGEEPSPLATTTKTYEVSKEIKAPTALINTGAFWRLCNPSRLNLIFFWCSAAWGDKPHLLTA